MNIYFCLYLIQQDFNPMNHDTVPNMLRPVIFSVGLSKLWKMLWSATMGTVRNSLGDLIQFIYGENGMEIPVCFGESLSVSFYFTLTLTSRNFLHDPPQDKENR